jgi:hypothetical protein
MNFFELINQHRYLYLTGATEPKDNALKLVIAEAKVSDSRETVGIGSLELEDAAAIEVMEDSSIYEIVFDEYIAFSVRNESYSQLDDEEEFEGRLACVYSKSKFLDYVRASTFASDDYPGPFKHYGFNCLNHIVDIVSATPPKIVEQRSNR